MFLILPEHGDVEEESKQKNIEFSVVPCFTQLYYYKPQWKYLALPILVAHAFLRLPKLKGIAQKFAPDLIYSNTSAENLGIKIAKALNVKHISHIREFMDLDHDAKYIFGRKRKKEYINQSDGVIYVSNSVANHVNMGEPLKEWQRVIYNGVDTVDWEYSDKSMPEDLNLGVVGIFDPEKGQDVAIGMMPSILMCYPKAKLHVWGDKEGKYNIFLKPHLIHQRIKPFLIFPFFVSPNM